MGADDSSAGSSVECRIMPRMRCASSSGVISHLSTPGGPFVRDDGGVYSGAEVTPHYDPLISKLSTWGPDRHTAILRMRRALDEYVVSGIRTNIAFHQRLMHHPAFIAGDYHTGFLGDHGGQLCRDEGPRVPEEIGDELAAALAVVAARRARTEAGAGDDDAQGRATSAWLQQHRSRPLGGVERNDSVGAGSNGRSQREALAPGPGTNDDSCRSTAEASVPDALSFELSSVTPVAHVL